MSETWQSKTQRQFQIASGACERKNKSSNENATRASKTKFCFKAFLHATPERDTESETGSEKETEEEKRWKARTTWRETARTRERTEKEKAVGSDQGERQRGRRKER